MSRTHQLYRDLQQERIRSAALRLELYRVRKDKDALKTQLDAAHAELAALKEPVLSYADEQPACTTAAQYEAMCLSRVEKGWPGDPPPPRPFIRQK